MSAKNRSSRFTLVEVASQKNRIDTQVSKLAINECLFFLIVLLYSRKSFHHLQVPIFHLINQDANLATSVYFIVYQWWLFSRNLLILSRSRQLNRLQDTILLPYKSELEEWTTPSSVSLQAFEFTTPFYLLSIIQTKLMNKYFI